VIAGVSTAITIGLFGYGTYLHAIPSALFTCVLIRWASRTWPWTTRLELFLTQTKPPLQVILGTSETEIDEKGGQHRGSGQERRDPTGACVFSKRGK
jgi:hypothetical protein